MPLYEFRCNACDAREEVFVRAIGDEVPVPECPKSPREPEHVMVRTMSPFQQHLTMRDKIEEAEARWGKEIDAAMGPEPDVDKYARRYEELARDLPPAKD